MKCSALRTLTKNSSQLALKEGNLCLDMQTCAFILKSQIIYFLNVSITSLLNIQLEKMLTDCRSKMVQ